MSEHQNTKFPFSPGDCVTDINGEPFLLMSEPRVCSPSGWEVSVLYGDDEGRICSAVALLSKKRVERLKLRVKSNAPTECEEGVQAVDILKFVELLQQ